jgi:hypothetical protein
MNVKEISKQLRMLDTKFANAKKHLAALNLEQDAEESIIETLDAQHLVLAKGIMDPKVPVKDHYIQKQDSIIKAEVAIQDAASNGVHVEMPKV